MINVTQVISTCVTFCLINHHNLFGYFFVNTYK